MKTTDRRSGNMGWIGVDLDGTAAYYDGWRGVDHIGPPIARIIMLIKDWRAHGVNVRIFTARVANGARAIAAVEAWCLEHIGEVLPVTNVKDMHMVMLFDDRCVTIEPNTGKFLAPFPEQLKSRTLNYALEAPPAEA